MLQAQNQSVDVYVCTGKGGSANPPANAGGIQLFQLSLSDGTLSPVAFVSEPPNAGFLAVHPDGRHLYGLHGLREVNGQPGSGASAFSIEPESGRLRVLNLQSVRGLWPSYSVFDATGRWLIATNYGTGNVVVLPIRE